ncbi:MAG: hypothetical protein DRR08_14875 [Candidatus Parabeggiatoa sp. nov. 2]|nr:MAG: hypothetical protein B6247_21265 [Beggiatoa sp. 4572_84]RKZ59035.1 MAG: hypothetical protein DRR08_14875 [Gammaproteobacteria bacterium]
MIIEIKDLVGFSQLRLLDWGFIPRLSSRLKQKIAEFPFLIKDLVGFSQLRLLDWGFIPRLMANSKT